MTKDKTVSDSRFEALMDAAVEAIVLIDPKGEIVAFNRSAERLFGYLENEIIGRNISVLMTGADKIGHDGYLERYLSGAEPKIIGIGRTLTAVRKDGVIFPIELSVGEYKQSNMHGFVGILRDLSVIQAVEKEAEANRHQLLQIARSGLMSEMGGSMAHELNQPLSAITLFAESALRMVGKPSQEADLQDTLVKIAEQSMRAGDIIQRVRNFIRQPLGCPEIVVVEDLLHQAVDFLRYDIDKCGVSVTLEIGVDSPILVDRLQLLQVIVNLLLNSIQAVSLGPRTSWTVFLCAKEIGKGLVELSVLDNGPGVSHEVVPNLFSAFVTTKENGMGIGLALSRSIVEAAGGKLSYVANESGGAGFFIVLPRGHNH